MSRTVSTLVSLFRGSEIFGLWKPITFANRYICASPLRPRQVGAISATTLLRYRWKIVQATVLRLSESRLLRPRDLLHHLFRWDSNSTATASAISPQAARQLLHNIQWTNYRRRLRADIPEQDPEVVVTNREASRCMYRNQRESGVGDWDEAVVNSTSDQLLEAAERRLRTYQLNSNQKRQYF